MRIVNIYEANSFSTATEKAKGDSANLRPLILFGFGWERRSASISSRRAFMASSLCWSDF